MKKIILVAIAMLSFVLAGHGAHAEDGVTVRDAWARASAGASKIGAAYLVLTNTGTAAERLVGASSPASRAVELHTTMQEGDVMRMQHLDNVELAPGASVEFKPGGLHMMLVDLTAPLKAGGKFPLTLDFASGAKKTVEVTVLGPGAMGPQSMTMHKHE